MNVLKMQNVAMGNSHLLRDKNCKHISQNYNLIIVHIQSTHDERVSRARTTLTITRLVLIESAIVTTIFTHKFHTHAKSTHFPNFFFF